MAFGFGFNKQKVLAAAEKCVQQGKLQQAIAEYEKILKADPKDLTVSNTVGDLYARLGNNDKAVDCFKSVGDAYASQGFTVKAIAMYKKLTKVKPTLEGTLRLAELYTQQGLFNDARAQYMQVAEEFLRTGELEQAVRIFQKTLEMDPENVSMRTKLAEVYIRLGKKTEAWQIFSSAAEALRSRGQLPQAEEILQRMLKLDPGNSYALLLRGRTAMEAGDFAAAISHLEKIADLDSHPDGLRTLLQAYLQTGRYPEAGTVAAKLYAVHNDSNAITSYADSLMAAGQYQETLKVYEEYADRLLATDSAKVLETLHSLIGHLRDNTAALQTVLELLNKAGDNTHLTEVYELLAHAFVQSGELEKARDYYLKLTQLEPQNQLHANNYQQVLMKLGAPSNITHGITAEEGAVLVDELEATAPNVDQRYADDVALSVRSALTDAELFISYNMPAKALGPLLSALPLAPRDLRLNQRLAALHTRAGRFAEAAVCCRTLESIYHDAGYPEEASRYGELAAKYEQNAPGQALESMPVASAPEPPTMPPQPPAPPAAAPVSRGLYFHAGAAAAAAPAPAKQEAAEFEVEPAVAADEHEIDLSEEWEGGEAETAAPVSFQQPEPAVAASRQKDPAVATRVVEEIRFYLSNSMPEQAAEALGRLEKLTNDVAQLSALRQEIEAAMAPSGTEADTITVETVDSFVEPEFEAPKPKVPQPETKPAALEEFVTDLESSLGDSFPAAPAPPSVSQTAPQAQPAPAPPIHAQPAAGNLGEFVADLEQSLGDGFPQAAPAESQPVQTRQPAPKKAAPPTPTQPPAMAASAAAAAPSPAPQPAKAQPVGPAAGKSQVAPGPDINLADMFGELKHELEEETAVSDEDPETHYNLGVAFREMGLLDEAIGELQKVCQSAERGHPFPQLMQTYTWLAQCFLDKGVPEAAVRWYESALKLANLDQDTRIALNYELGSAYEMAGNKAAALNHFMEVYGSNIDYRDVAERIQALKS